MTPVCRLPWLILITMLLSACGATPQQKTAPVVVTESRQPQIADVEFSPQDYLQRAEEAWYQAGDLYLRNQNLLLAAESFRQQQECINSDKVLLLLLQELEDTQSLTHAHLLLAECELQRDAPDFDKIDGHLTHMALYQGYDARVQAVRAALFAHQRRWVDAAIATLASDHEDASSEVWRLVQQLTLVELENARLNQTGLQAWTQLALISRRYGADPENLSREVTDWQQRFADHPLAVALPQELQLAMQTPPIKPQRIAVLLPLTGRLATQGQALKYGMLAAYYDEYNSQFTSNQPAPDQPVMHFFNSALKSPADMADMVAGYDFIIGPLLKEDITGLSELLPDNARMLALNRVDAIERPLDRETYYYALAPEDEAAQLAQHVIEQGYRNPVIVSAQAAVPQRMTQAFRQHWQQHASKDGAAMPSVASFTDNTSMRNSVSTLLDVAQSKQRIDQIEDLLTTELHSVPRNRRDIDAIVVFATPEQTELLNPMIEASMSPFSDKVVPVYASSRSYSRELSKNSLRDLRNLTFTDMPFMLPDNPWQQLGSRIDDLFPGQNSVLRRLFAMGYDAYNGLPELRHLRLLPYTSSNGLSGELAVDAAGNIVRRLPWGKITNDRVILLAMD